MTEAEEIEIGLRHNRLQGVLPELREVIGGMQRAIDAKAGQALAAGTMDGEYAKQLWVEKASLWSLLKRFEGRALGVGLE